MKYITTLITIGFLTLTTFSHAGNLSPANKQFLSGYEKVRAALAADDLDTARKAASSLGDAGTSLAKSQSLDQARTAFEKLSAQAITLTAGQPAYHLLHCDMVNKDWVQPNTQVSNPYVGKDMASCGEVKK